MVDSIQIFANWYVGYNAWDNGYEGNYWSDYTSRYPNATTNDSGIWDTPFYIKEANIDRFPLTEPVDVETSTPTPEPRPEITVLSPANQTYNETIVSLAFTVNKPAVWMGYSLDGQETVTITGNTTIGALSNGVHNVTVYARDEFDNMGTSETISFSIAEEPFPVAPVAAAAAASVTIIGVGLLVYFKKRKH